MRRQGLRRLALFVAAWAAAGAALPQESHRPALIDLLRAEPRGPDVFLRFHLDGALNPELATKIQAGLETTIRYEIRLYRHNAHWFWDYRMDSRVYRVAVTYDPVTREYVVVETLDNKPLARFTTKDFHQVTQRLVSHDNLLAFRVAFTDWRTNLYITMRATFDSGYLFTIIPVDSRTAWRESNRFEIKPPIR
ncbi:MAG TPA: DUF4390 domain-containing protein [Thermoanaerobaculia bacterium]|nr:DUF4390 domain-containing protein [Thermoanaerobaculia bacterium]